MPEVWIVVDEEVDQTGELVASSPITAAMVNAIAQAVEKYPPQNAKASVANSTDLKTLYSKLVYAGDLTNRLNATEILFCPLTLNIPPNFSFPHQQIYQACRDVIGLQQLVQQQLGYPSGLGNLWLPVVWTKKGPLYAEAIGPAHRQEIPENLSPSSLSYIQPIHLSDAQRQLIYEFGFRLLKLLAAPPATYLIQFDFTQTEEKICFDRLWPFPAPPAIASLGIQSPDLFTCHWHCLTDLPIFDLVILKNKR